ncbi:hypothetical protein [Escherichia coli]|uniref:hypothetical protein n=1 Tax=Escherichia coli TaxID=562 RepID=UPI000B7FEF12|nr:hypothetical protein [Escherichia coli]
MLMQQKTYQCQAAGRLVTLTQQTLYVFGIGDDVPGMQYDYGCNQEHTCPYRYTDACEVQRHNR